MEIDNCLTMAQLIAENEKLSAGIQQLRELIGAEQGGETPGDTLRRMADDIRDRDWRNWVKEYGQRLNDAVSKVASDR